MFLIGTRSHHTHENRTALSHYPPNVYSNRRYTTPGHPQFLGKHRSDSSLVTAYKHIVPIGSCAPFLAGPHGREEFKQSRVRSFFRAAPGRVGSSSSSLRPSSSSCSGRSGFVWESGTDVAATVCLCLLTATSLVQCACQVCVCLCACSSLLFAPSCVTTRIRVCVLCCLCATP